MFVACHHGVMAPRDAPERKTGACTMNHRDVAAPAIDAVDPLLIRIKAEFTEMPGLQLTPWQAQRLWGLEQQQCDRALAALVADAFLHRRANGAYVRC
jgi:hypothetical protein